MEKSKTVSSYRRAFVVLILSAIGGVSFAFGIYAARAHADETPSTKQSPRVVYPKKTELDFEGLQIEGEVRNPGEFYFQHRPEEKFDSLVKRRKNFHEQMLRDAIMSR